MRRRAASSRRLLPGPTRIADIAKRTTIDPQDLLANALVLCSAHDIRPAEPDHAPVDALNRAVLRRLDGAEEIEYLALPCGTAIRLDRALLALLRDGKPLENGEFAVWRELLATLAP